MINIINMKNIMNTMNIMKMMNIIKINIVKNMIKTNIVKLNAIKINIKKIKQYLKMIGNYFGFTNNPLLSVYVGDLYVVVVFSGNYCKKNINNDFNPNNLNAKESVYNVCSDSCVIKNLYDINGLAENKQNFIEIIMHAIQDAINKFNLDQEIINVCLLLDDEMVIADTLNLPADIQDANVIEEIAAFLEEKYNLMLEDIYFDYLSSEKNAQQGLKAIKLFFLDKSKLVNLVRCLSSGNALNLKVIEIHNIALQRFVEHKVDSAIESFYYLEINVNKIKLIYFVENKIIDIKNFSTKVLFSLQTDLELFNYACLSFSEFFAVVIDFIFASCNVNFNELNDPCAKTILCAGELIYMCYGAYMDCKNKIFARFALQDIPCLDKESVEEKSINKKNINANIFAFAPVFGASLRGKI